MVQLAQRFDARQVRPSDPDGGSGFVVGAHKSYISKTEMVENSQKKGHMLVLTVNCFEGPEKGKVMLYRLNLWHTESQDAVRIAYEQLSALCHVTGVFDIANTDELVNKPFITIVESQNDPQYPTRTQIKGVLDLNGDKPGQPGVKGRIPEPQAPGAAPGPAAPAPAPWTPNPSAPAANSGTPQPWGPNAGASAPAAPVQAPAAPSAQVPFTPLTPVPTAPAQAPAWAPPGAQVQAVPGAGGPPAWAAPR